jgi:alginate O-acetyltransferase complex protein AlgI
MLFSSPIFFVFFLAYFGCHLLVPRAYRNYLIIVGSTVFYAWWKVEYTWIPFFLMAIAYFGAYAVGRAKGSTRFAYTAATIVVLFLPLVIFKYTDFFYRDVFGPVFGWHDKVLDAALPLGVSFVTFTLTAYVVDIYRGNFPAQNRASTVLAYVLFFPHLIAGPILRPDELIPQLEQPPSATLRRIAVPLAIFTVGLVKKLVFADQIGEIVDPVFNPGSAAPGALEALLAIYGFSVQIYCDFSGYTDMAIALALLLGVRLPNNFLRPYAAESLVEFWRRWHITLSFWLRDYLYIPLGGNRGGRAMEVRNILITMVLGGLWHGANWTFVIWGLLHGIGLSLVHLKNRLLGDRFRLPKSVAVLITFHFVTFAWILFRAPTLHKAGQVMAAPFSGNWPTLGDFIGQYGFFLFLIAFFFATHRYDDHRHIRAFVRYTRAEILWPLLGLLWILAITLSQGSSAKFIYFDF